MEILLETAQALAIVGLLVGINAFFVASEFALVSIRRSRVDELISQGNTAAVSVKTAILDLDRYIAATQIGITIASLALGWAGEPIVARLFSPLFRIITSNPSELVIHTTSYIVSFSLITFAHVILGELIPKSIALQKPETTSILIGRPMWLFAKLFYPLIFLLNGCGNFFLKLIGFNPTSEYHAAHSMDELDILVQESHKAGVLDDLERKMLERTIHFSELSAGAIKTPRTDIDALDLSKTNQELIEELTESEHTRLPLFEGTIDNIIGIIHVQDVFRQIANGNRDLDLRTLAKKPFVVPESIGLDDLVTQLRQQETKLAIVVDEHGSTAGLITVRDIVEEIFGSVSIESDGLSDGFCRNEDGSIIVRGDFRLDEIQRDLAWNLQDEDVDTIAGYVMKELGRVAQLGDKVECPAGTIEVTKMNKLRVMELVLKPRRL